MLGDQTITLEDIFEICEAKHDKHVIYSRIIFDFEQLEKNKKIMNLGNPMLDDQEKEYILNCVKESSYKLDIPEFIKLYTEDGLGNILKNVDYWIRDNWTTIDRYNKAKK